MRKREYKVLIKKGANFFAPFLEFRINLNFILGYHLYSQQELVLHPH